MILELSNQQLIEVKQKGFGVNAKSLRGGSMVGAEMFFPGFKLNAFVEHMAKLPGCENLIAHEQSAEWALENL